MKIPQLRVCVTEICDKKCFYCRPEGEGCSSFEEDEKLLTEDFIYLINEVVKEGVSVIRFTGGEPMLNKDIYKIIHAVSQMEGINDISIVTRSLKLKEQAPLLKEAGINSITVSLDSLNRGRLIEITKVDLLDKLVEGIKVCSDIGIPVKINSVIMKGINDDEINAFIEFISGIKNVEWKLCDYMLLSKQFNGDKFNKLFLDLSSILPNLRELAEKEIVDTQAGGLGIPMPTFKLKNGIKIYVKDSTAGNHYGDTCQNCKYFPCQDGIMALRLTAYGKLQRCLYREDNLIDLKPFMKIRNGNISHAINQALDTFKNSVFHPNAWNPSSLVKFNSI